MNEHQISFMAHLKELRQRLIKCGLAVTLSGTLVYHYCGTILKILAQPVGQLVFIDPTEALMTYIKISIWGGLFLASPVVIYQLWQFIASGLKENERRHIVLYAPASLSLFLGGVVFFFFFIVRAGIEFLLFFLQDIATPMITMSNYVSFLGATCLAFGFVFQLPLAMLCLTRLGLVTPSFFITHRKFAVVGIFIASGILTPSPDIFSQLAMSLPLLILFEIGIGLAKLASAQRASFALSNQH